MEDKRFLTILYLDPLKTYLLKNMEGKTIASETGLTLKSKGFEVTLNKFYDGKLFEITGH